jgi:hypothetical protein
MKIVMKYTPYPEPTAEDWIIMRVVREWVLDSSAYNHNLTAIKSVDFLLKKLGSKTVRKMIDALSEERANANKE